MISEFLRNILPLSLIALLFNGCTTGETTKEEPDSKPNVLFISIDDLNDWTGFLGGHPQAMTPHMDRLAAASTVFTNAQTVCAACQPSRNALLSGLHPTSTGWYSNVWDRDLKRSTCDSINQTSTALPLYFKKHGYTTMAAGKIYHSGEAEFPDYEKLYWDTTIPDYRITKKFRERGHHYGDAFFHPFPRGGSPIVSHYNKRLPGFSLCGGPLQREKDIPNGIMPDEYFANWAIERLEEKHDKPFFLAIGFVRPHVPYTAPAKYFDMQDRENIQIPTVPEDEMEDIPLYGKAMAMGILPGGDHATVLDMGKDYWKELVHAYLSCVTFVDDQVGRVLTALANSPYGENTIIVLWSDHGQQLGEKKSWRKMDLWEEANRVPFIIKLPGQTQSKKVSAVVSLLDIYPTLVDLCQLPVNKNLEGNPLTELIENPDIKWNKPVVSCWKYKNFSVRDNQWRYIRYRDGKEELYNHQDDPGEHHNLAHQKQYLKVKEALKKHIPDTIRQPFMQPWDGDDLEAIIRKWESSGIPDWLN